MKRISAVFLGLWVASCAAPQSETTTTAAEPQPESYECNAISPGGCLKKGAAQLEAGDRAGARSSYENACTLELAEGCRSAAAIAVEDGLELGKARELLRKGCTLSDAESCERLGRLFAQDLPSSPADPAQALQFLARACKLGSDLGCIDAGLAFEKGIGAPPSPEQALTLLTAACDRDSAIGCLNLAQFYARYPSLPNSRDAAFAALEKSCGLGDLDACVAVGTALERGAGDPARARELYEAGCVEDHARSCTLLGSVYERGAEGLEADPKKAAKLYEKACNGGDANGCTRFNVSALGGCPEDTRPALNLAAYYCLRQDGTRDGPFREIYQKATLKTIGAYSDGQKDGEWLSYYPDGAKQSRETWDGGELNGVSESWYPDGKQRSKANYVNGIVEGVATTFFESGNRWTEEKRDGDGFIKEWRDDGSKVLEGTFKKGRRVGTWTYYGFEGRVLATNELGSDGNGDFVAFDPQGRKTESGKIVNGLRSGVWSVFSPDGKLAQKVTYRRDLQNGDVTAYFPNGQISAKGSLRSGKRNGNWREYFDSGQLRFEVKFTNDLPVGPAKEYDEKGRTVREVEFPNRPLPRGQIALYRDSFGVRHGTYVSYHPNGKKARQEVWDLGTMKDATSWDQSGKVLPR